MGAPPAASHKVMEVSVTRIGGAERHVELSVEATVQDLRDVIDLCGFNTRKLAYRIMCSAAVLQPGTAKLVDFGVQHGSTITMLTEFARDYAKITSFERSVQCGKYPNGVLIDQHGQLFVSHYFGQLQVYNPEYSLVKSLQLPGSSPSQMARAPTGEVLIAFRSNRKVGVFNPSLEHVRDIGAGMCPSGVAVAGDFAFVSDSQEQEVRVLRFQDGQLIETLGGKKGNKVQLSRPSGLAIVDDSLLAIADRGSNCVLLLRLDNFDLARRLPADASDGSAQLRQPNDVAVDSAGNLLVMDTGNERIAVYREDGSFLASVMQGFFKDHGNTFSYLACNHDTGAIAVSNNDEHSVAVLAPLS